MNATAVENADRLAATAAERLQGGNIKGAKRLYRHLLALDPANWSALASSPTGPTALTRR